jgi:hypothetical protein
MLIHLNDEQKRVLFFALLLATLETLLFLVGRAVEKDYGTVYGALLMFGLNFLFLIPTRRS